VTGDEARTRLRACATARLGFAPSAMVDGRIDDALGRLTHAGSSAAAVLDALASLAFDAPAWQVVVEALAVGETNFFRQPAWFSQLERQILRPAIERRQSTGAKRLRIWSAGCATGEEAYSLAILVLRLLPNADGWEINITGTDVSNAFLSHAARAVYREWSLRELDDATRERHFTKLDSGRFALRPATRAWVTFTPLNLADEEPWDSRLTGLDLIVCRNVLMYLAPERQRAIAQRLIECLAPDGWLATAPAEATAEWFHPLKPVNVPSAVLFRRDPFAQEPVKTVGLHAVPTVPAKPAARPIPAAPNTELSDSAAALAAARRALDTSIRRSGE
jgi:chemotaxis protein methyltransferase CheR